MECVLQGERSLLMQFSMHESDCWESCFLLSFKVLKDHIQDLGGIVILTKQLRDSTHNSLPSCIMFQQINN